MRPTQFLLNLMLDHEPGLSDASPTLTAQIHHTRLELVQGDITLETTDAIVNAANSSLLGGGGVDGAIHRAAGPHLLEATRQLGGCETGDAKITGGFNLKARYVIHAVGPVYRAGDPSVPALLASAYRNSLKLAQDYQLESVAMPAISTGIYGYPLAEAAPIALQTTIDFVSQQEQIKLVRFVLFSESILEVFARTLTNLTRAK